MTSNAGAENIVAPKSLGFTSETSEEKEHEDMKSKVMEEYSVRNSLTELMT